MNEKKNRTVVYAHRGASGYELENSYSAFEKAIELGADGLETDCWLSGDKKTVILHHGQNLQISPDTTSRPIAKLSVEEIGLPTRVANALVKAEVHTVEDLVNADREELMKVRNLGEKSLKIIDVALAEKGVNVEEIKS